MFTASKKANKWAGLFYLNCQFAKNKYKVITLTKTTFYNLECVSEYDLNHKKLSIRQPIQGRWCKAKNVGMETLYGSIVYFRQTGSVTKQNRKFQNSNCKKTPYNSMN